MGYTCTVPALLHNSEAEGSRGSHSAQENVSFKGLEPASCPGLDGAELFIVLAGPTHLVLLRKAPPICGRTG